MFESHFQIMGTKQSKETPIDEMPDEVRAAVLAGRLAEEERQRRQEVWRREHWATSRQRVRAWVLKTLAHGGTGEKAEKFHQTDVAEAKEALRELGVKGSCYKNAYFPTTCYVCIEFP